jgi:hypothetical protein
VNNFPNFLNESVVRGIRKHLLPLLKPHLSVPYKSIDFANFLDVPFANSMPLLPRDYHMNYGRREFSSKGPFNYPNNQCQ